MAGSDELPFDKILDTLKQAVGALRDAHIPFALAGGIASWARGGPPREHDLDFFVKPADADRALAALADAGMRPEKPPEGWLYKAYDGDVMVDLIFEPASGPVTDAELDRAEELEVQATRMRVLAPTDILATKLLALKEHDVDYDSVLEISRALREQVDWDDLRARTAHSPYAKAFFTLVEELGVMPRDEATL
ncbi:MAG: nucleotidyltransferase family protein [Gaiellaceae bacterium]